MFINIRENRIDLDEIVRYYTYVHVGNKNYILNFYLKGIKDYSQITFESEEELKAVLEFIDQYLNVKHLKFTPEKEVTKSKLEVL